MSFPNPGTPANESHDSEPEQKNQPDLKTRLKHIGLFILTFLSVSYFGVFFVGQSAGIESFMEMWSDGILFAALLLGFLAAHEFGHYYAAVIHNVRVSLPYFIPIPLGIGTMGAVISIRERIRTTTKMFDIGVAGPVAGFVVSLAILLYGFATLPGPDFIENFAGHDEVIAHVQETGTFPEAPPELSEGSALIIIGDTILYSFMASFFDDVPPMYEMYHYPFLFAGWLGLFFTALNLMPVGQLDGGHILFSLIGQKRQAVVARLTFGTLTLLGGLEAIPFLYMQLNAWFSVHLITVILLWLLVLFLLLRKAFQNAQQWVVVTAVGSLMGSVAILYLQTGGQFNFETGGSLIWVVWCFFLAYFVKMEHPPVTYNQPLSRGRVILGWASMAIFILCISPAPFQVIG
ncbi:MAG: site-2 protease family protein [Balneolaceae bacterium]